MGLTEILNPADVKPILAVLGILAIVYTVVSTIISYRKLQHTPGPRLAAFSQLWLFNVTSKGDVYKAAEMCSVNTCEGTPARIGPNMIIHDDPEMVKFIAAPCSPFRRGHWYKAMKFDTRIDNLLSERNETRHIALRAKMMPGYTGKEVPGLEPKIDARILDLVNLIKSYISRNQPFDFAEKAQYFTLDSLTDIAFGYPFGYLTKDEDLYNYNKSSTGFFPVMELATNIPFIHRIISSSIMQALFGPKPEDKQGLGAIIGVAQKVVAQRFDPQTEKHSSADRDMLDAFIQHGLMQLECESESCLQILAGSDSTATTIRMTFLLLLTNPPIYNKLRTEIDNAIERGNISFPVVQNTEALKLPYLQACIKEGLRLWQPLNGIVTKDAPAEGVTITDSRGNDMYIPGGTQVCLSQHSMMRRKDLFGPDADLFRPERWTEESDPDVIKGYERVWDYSFSAGRFTCLGKGIALIEINKVLVELMRRFDFGPVNPLDTMRTKCHQLHVQKDMTVRAWERKN